jgi:CubicO group peptidase (beta-lactamase class C family)
LRRLLSHRSGLTDYAGFREAVADRPLPTLREILETGRWTPAPIRVGFEPGSRFAYSGGGYCLMEQLLEDVSGNPFSKLARELAFVPLQMQSSSFEQELPPERAGRAAAGHQWNGKTMPRRWNRYPATSAAGLWTTPSDLARFAIELQKAGTGSERSILSPVLAAEMLSVQGPPSDRDSKVIALREAIADQPPPAWGLGLGLIGRPPTRIFHTGSNPGYQCELQALMRRGQGAVVMTNGDQGWRLAREVLWSIAREYDWPDPEYRPEIRKTAPLSADELERFTGRYRISFSRLGSWILSVARDDHGLSAQILDQTQKVPLYAASTDTCFSVEDAMTLQFLKDASGRFEMITSDVGWTARRAPD